MIAAGVGALAIPFEILARLENAPSDPITDADPEAEPEPA